MTTMRWARRWAGPARAPSRSRSPTISRAQNFSAAYGANLAVIEAAGEIVDGTAQGDIFNASAGIASDDLSEAIRQAARDPSIKAIVLRVDSPGGSVTASDQILDAVKKAQAKGKPVVVSMGGLAASGGYYISASANKIVARARHLDRLDRRADRQGGVRQVAEPGRAWNWTKSRSARTPDGFARSSPTRRNNGPLLNHEADVIYDDFLHKVAAGRKLPFEQVQAAAKGRVWTGADAKTQGLVDGLGGFWTAAGMAAELGGVSPDQIAIKIYPRRRGLVESLGNLMGRSEASLKALEGASDPDGAAGGSGRCGRPGGGPPGPGGTSGGQSCPTGADFPRGRINPFCSRAGTYNFRQDSRGGACSPNLRKL